MYRCQHLWRSVGSLWKLILSWHVGYKDWAQVIGLGSKCPYPPNQLNVFDLKQSSKNSNSLWAPCEEAWSAINPLQSLQSPGSSVFEVSFPKGVRWLSDFLREEQGVWLRSPSEPSTPTQESSSVLCVGFKRVCHHLRLLHLCSGHGLEAPVVEGSLDDLATVLVRVLGEG